ncbi:MAG TPA: PilZ domain-containing protein [Polyangiaceae bacterium]|nr:PilZ domain-containing protein [Polyangiaceae bacterium]
MNHLSPTHFEGSERPGAPAAVHDHSTSQERRRLGERTPVVFDATVFRGSEIRLTRTLDLSSTGCALQGCADPLAGRVTLQLVASSGEVLRVQARFRRSFQGADAYEFVDLDDTDRLTIAEIIDTFREPVPEGAH